MVVTTEDKSVFKCPNAPGHEWVGEQTVLRGFDHLELYPWLGNSSEGCSLPIGLLCLFPHYHVEGGGVLVAEDEACIIIIGHRVHVERSLKVNPTERCVACTNCPWKM